MSECWLSARILVQIYLTIATPYSFDIWRNYLLLKDYDENFELRAAATFFLKKIPKKKIEKGCTGTEKLALFGHSTKLTKLARMFFENKILQTKFICKICLGMIVTFRDESNDGN